MKWRDEKQKKNQQTKNAHNGTKHTKNLLSESLNDNVTFMMNVFEDCGDIVFRSFSIGGDVAACIVYFENLVDKEKIDDHILASLMKETNLEEDQLERVINEKISVSDVEKVDYLDDCVQWILHGYTLVLINGLTKAYVAQLPKYDTRAIEDPPAESVIRGPREGFIESLPINTSLIRRKIKSPKLKMKKYVLGRYTYTQVVMAYIDDLVDQDLIDEVVTRLNRIEIDGVIESGYIEEFIEDNTYSPFPQILHSERPDVAAANLLEGRIVILVDGSPFVLILPVTLFSFIQAPEDYYQRSMMSSLIRTMRDFFLGIALLLPSFYVAILTFHQEMVPTNLLLRFAAAREQLPFPALVEALLMEITFEALREAGLRLPKQAGAAVSIVGALVVGEAAVSAGLVSSPMVMVVAITGIASFTIPRFSLAISLRMLRFPMIILAGTLGLVGIMLGIILIIVHLSSLRSFGVPYLAPIAPLKVSELKDTFIRAPWWSMRKRPHLTGQYRPERVEGGKQNPNSHRD
ncbi:spore germination protein [Bacillus kexueae]|uniref:spore germination protein n=1 Tax=Aeribacillus kexueae TaxID=2078952 RepID=UPI001FAFDA19|nr:spore germination protein [Bacillus kexueae]